MPIVNHDKCLLCKSQNISIFITSKDYALTREKFDIYQCASCGFLFTQDAPSEDNMTRYYSFEDYISHSDTKKKLADKIYHLCRSFMLRRKQKLIDNVCHQKKGALLDVGCGTGYFLNVMRRKGWDVVGIEKNKVARAIAKQKFNLETLPSDQLINLDERSFDVITLWHVLEHVHSAEIYLQHMHRVLKDRGVLIVAVPNQLSFDAQYYQKYWAAYDLPRHLWHFSPITIGNLTNRLGFKVIAKQRMVLDAFYVSMLSEKYRENRLSALAGIWVGFISNLACLRNVNKCSSIVYILEKKK